MSIRHKTARILLNSKRVLTDAIQLTHQFLKDRPNNLELSRQILRRNAEHVNKGGNSLAYTLLRLDREIVFIRYKGMILYIRDKVVDYTVSINKPSLLWYSQASDASKVDTTSTHAKNSKGDIHKNNASSKVARVAFMITTQQKRILREMAYTEANIRGLKPLEALLIIENAISCNEEDWRAMVSDLVNAEMLNQSKSDDSQAIIEEKINNEHVESELEQSPEITSKRDFKNDQIVDVEPKIGLDERKQKQLLLPRSGKDQLR